MLNLNQNLVVEELISHCNFCLLKLAKTELVAHSECQKLFSKYENKNVKPIFRKLFRLEEKDFRFNLKYWPFLSKNPEIRPKTDSNFLCPFRTIKTQRIKYQIFDNLFNFESDDLRYGIECFREFEEYFLRPEIMIYDDKHYSDIFARYNHYKIKID